VKFLLDHDVPDRKLFARRRDTLRRFADVLAHAAHSVLRLREVLVRESTDDAIFAFAATESLILITCNRDDFLRLAARRAHAGIIILIRRQSRTECASVLRLIETSGESGLTGNINFA